MSELKAITSPIVEKKLGYEIKNESLTYYLLYRIMIETGISFSQLKELKVSSFRDKTSITYTLKKGGICTESFSEDTINTICKYIVEKSDEEYMFCNKFLDSPVSPTNFKRTLERCAKRIKYPHTVNLAVLKRTYFFHLLERTQNISTFKRRINLRLDKEIFDYLGIETYPQKILTWNKDVYTLLYETTNIEVLKEEFNNFLIALSKINSEEILPDIIYKESYETLKLISQSLLEYKDFLEKSGMQ